MAVIIQGSPLSLVHRELIIALAARHKLPAVYFLSPFVIGGGLISYGADLVDHSRRAAGYVDRILKGEKPAGAGPDLRPVFLPIMRRVLG